jgi:hypothetical protein
VLHNNGDGTFGTPLGQLVGGFPFYAAAGDVDGDGQNDLAATNGPEGNVLVLLNS